MASNNTKKDPENANLPSKKKFQSVGKRLLDKNGNYELFLKDLEKEIQTLANSNRHIIKVYEDVLRGTDEEPEEVEEKTGDSQEEVAENTTTGEETQQNVEEGNDDDDTVPADDIEVEDESIMIAVEPVELTLFKARPQETIDAHMKRYKIDPVSTVIRSECYVGCCGSIHRFQF